MILISWNVNGIRAIAKKGFHDIIANLNPDILCLQETKAQVDQVREVVFDMNYHIYANHATKKGYSGTAILSKEKMDTSFFNFEKDFKVSETIDMPEVNDNMDLKSAIGIAMKNEELAMKKYTALSENCDDPQLKKVFMDLAAMERDHKFKMENKFVDVAYPEVW